MYKQYSHTDIFRHITESTKNNPDKVAIYVGERSITYKELFSLSGKITTNIINFLSQTPRQEDTPVRIGVFMPRNEHVEAAVLSIIQLGCTYVPIDTETPTERISFITRDASITFFLTEDTVKDMLPPDVPFLSMEEILKTPSKALQQTLSAPTGHLPHNGEGLGRGSAYIIYTSGTTGNPKGVPISYTNLYYYLLTAGREEHFHIHPESVMLHYSSISFDVSIMEIYTPLFYGAAIAVVNEAERKDVKTVYKIINQRKVTYVALPPTMFNLFPDYNFTSMETASVGGETMPRSLVERIGKRPYRFINGYGPSECTPVSSLRDMTSPDLWRNIGQPSHYATFIVVDENLRPVSPGEKGELLIGGPQVFDGYLNRPELTSEKLIDNPFPDTREKAPRLYRTGDIVRLMPDGSCEFLERKDSQIKLFGHRIELGEVMAHLEKCTEVRRAYTRTEGTGTNKRIVAFIQPHDPSVCQSNEKILETIGHIKQQMKVELPDYMIPTLWNFIEEFPLNINGKIDNSKLVNRPFHYIEEDEQDLTSDEKMLKQEVARVIEFDKISVNADLFDIYGLTSIQAMQVSLDLNTLGMQISALEMYKYRTVREIIKNRDARLCYWYNDDDTTQKPVIIVLSGYTSFGYMYTQWAEKLTDKYSIYVVEYYHAIIGDKRVKDIEELMAAYREMVVPVLATHNVCCFTGMCMGGEHALLLAQQLYADKAEKPHVIIIDGEIDRDTRSETNAHLRFPFLSDAENDLREDNDFTLMRTFPDFRYEGKLSIFLSGIFIDYYSYLDPDWNETKDAGMRNAFDTCRERWEKHYPDCYIGIMPSDHDNFWRSEPSLTILTDYYRQL
jgi:amino acid adenylation domain-containing protein